jgi:uncharacterized protein YqjF (DUF2071 family)
MTFLKAEWRDLVMLNWEISPHLLSKYIPRGTELDLWNGRAFVSLVGFRFIETRILKLPVPFHVNFEEVNLRFYVRRAFGDGIHRGVVFIKEIVPRTCIALVARRLYNENYMAAPMSHAVENRGGQTSVQYNWLIDGKTNSIAVRADGAYREMVVDSQEEFIAEHYWGYCRQRDGRTVEYRVHHPKWQVATVNEFSLDCDAVTIYGKDLGDHLLLPPVSAFLANGSKVEVGLGQRF